MITKTKAGTGRLIGFYSVVDDVDDDKRVVITLDMAYMPVWFR